MEKGWWTKPVTVRIGDVTYVVNNTFMAARMLLQEWPAERTTKHRAARVACVEAMEGGDQDAARAAFESAAREAGILA